MENTALERISGPILGHYVAAYAVPADHGWVGYAKICGDRPSDIWDCKPMEKIGGPLRRTVAYAMEDVEERAKLYLQLMLDYHGLYERADETRLA